MSEKIKKYLLDNRYLILAAAILLAAFCLRLGTFFAPMEYDEIWTLENFSAKPVRQILTDLATPNNHPLNTLFVKLWRHCFDLPQLIRLHSFVFGMLSILLTGVLALGLFRSRAAALFGMLFIAFDAAAVCYSVLARGYSMQLFFLLLFSCGLVWSGRLRKFLPGKYLPEAAIVLGALGAVLAVPSAPIFLASVLIAGRLYRRKMPEASVLIAIGIAGALIAAYLGFNYGALKEAQGKFGIRFTEMPQWFGFVLMVLQDLFALAVVPFLIVIAATDRKRAMLLGFCAVQILGSAAFFSAGPSRVYLPICVLIALGCGRGAHSLFTVALCRNNRKLAAILTVSAVFLAGFGCYQLYDTWHITDYWSWIKAGQSMPQEYLVVYPATAGYPLLWNNDIRKVTIDQLERLELIAPETRPLLCFGVEPGKINGMDGGRAERIRDLTVRGKPTAPGGFPAVEYLLRRAPAPRPGEAFVAVVNGETLAVFDEAGGEVLMLNPWFSKLTGKVMLCGTAPQDATVWEKARNSGAKVYTFVPDENRKRP